MNLSGAFLSVLAGIGGITISRRFRWTGYTKEKKMPPEYKYFTAEEVEGLNEEFVAKLDQARHIAGFPFVIASGLRTPEKNQSVIGAVPDSSHLTGMAVDLKVENDNEVCLLVDACHEVGIYRRGIYVDSNNVPTHVHVDVDLTKPQAVIWIKREGQANTAPVSA